jgi:predicted Zn-dependent protease
LRDLGRLDEAVVVFRQLLVTSPDSIGVNYNLGNILIAQGNAREGVALVAKADELQKGQ